MSILNEDPLLVTIKLSDLFIYLFIYLFCGYGHGFDLITPLLNIVDKIYWPENLRRDINILLALKF